MLQANIKRGEVRCQIHKKGGMCNSGNSLQCHSKDANEKQKMKHNPRVDAMLSSCTLIHMTILHIDAEQLTLMQCTIQLTLKLNS